MASDEIRIDRVSLARSYRSFAPRQDKQIERSASRGVLIGKGDEGADIDIFEFLNTRDIPPRTGIDQWSLRSLIFHSYSLFYFTRYTFMNCIKRKR